MYVVIFAVVALILMVVLLQTNATALFWFLAVFSGIMALLIIVRNFMLKKTIHKVPPSELSVLNLDRGGIFKLTGVGENSEELTLKVLAKHLYREGDFYWYELECDKGEGEKVWVEVEDDDETIVSVVLEKFKLRDLDVTPQYLKRMDDEEEGLVRYRGDTYYYAESDEAIFYRNCDDKKPEKLYYWDFESGGESKYTVSVERWGDKEQAEYQAFHSQVMKLSQITVFSNKASD